MKNRKSIMAGLLVVYWIIIFTLTHIPIPKVIYKAHVSDKALHFMVYLIFTFLFWAAVSPGKKIDWRKLTIWWVIPVLIIYGIIDEWLQGYVGRSMDVTDFLADLAGIATGLILLSFLEFKSCSIMVTGISILSISTLAKANIGDLMPKIYSLFHLLGYSFFAQLWIWKLCQYKKAINMARLKWIIVAYGFPLVFLAVVILTTKLMGRYFELRNMTIAFAAILITVTINIFALELSNKKITKDNTKNS